VAALSSSVVRKPLDTRVSGLIALITALGSGVLALGAPAVIDTVSRDTSRVGAVLGLTLVLQLFSVRIYGHGSISVSAIGILAAAFLLNPPTAMAIAMLAALIQWARARGQLHKAIFDGANFAVAAGSAALVYGAFENHSRLVGALAAGSVYAGINNGVLCLAMSLDEGTAYAQVWFERFHWARYYFLLFGPLALAASIAYEQIGIPGLLAFALPPGVMILSVRQYLEHTAAAVEDVRGANERLRRAHRDTIAALSRTMEAKDAYTGGHTERVAAVAVALARQLGYERADLEAIEIGALLHDVGKIGIPEAILHKDGPLDEGEWALMRTHPLVSDYILAELDLDPIVRQCARSSHERIDGRGYPDGLRSEEIPLPARIVFVADALDALTSDRAYRPRRSLIAALVEIEEHAGTQFCPHVVAALRAVWRTCPHLLAANEPSERNAA
jgi:putative nucleotidyltransferase with HDIG domain